MNPRAPADLLPLTAGAPPPEKIPPGGCDVYEGSGGALYVCCKSADGTHIDCYKAVIYHGDPWGDPLPADADINRLVANGQVHRIDPQQLGLATRNQLGRDCRITSNYSGQLFICCGAHCAPLPITVGELPVPMRRHIGLMSPTHRRRTPGCHVYALGPHGQLYMCCNDICAPLPILFGPLP